MYKVVLAAKAVKVLSKLPHIEQKRIGRVIDSLAKNPRPSGVRKLSSKDNLYRVVKGNYRIVYSIRDKKLLVLILRIGDRKDVYRNL